MKWKPFAAAVACAALASVGARSSRASLVNLGAGSFSPSASVITFDESADFGTVASPVENPSTTVSAKDLGNVTVSFGGSFVGQAASGVNPVTLDPHQPTIGQPLALDPAGPKTFITNDGAAASSPTLSGTPQFNGPISVLFSVPVTAVGLTGGFFDAAHSTSIEAYDANGNILGAITNSVTGFEFYGLADSSGANVIKGISFFITGNEPAGFEIDNLTFGAKTAVVVKGVPLPSAAAMGLPLMLGAGALTLARKRMVKA